MDGDKLLVSYVDDARVYKMASVDLKSDII